MNSKHKGTDAELARKKRVAAIIMVCVAVTMFATIMYKVALYGP